MSDLSVRKSDNPEKSDSNEEEDHLKNVPDGAGCVEIWEKLGEARDDD